MEKQQQIHYQQVQQEYLEEQLNIHQKIQVNREEILQFQPHQPASQLMNIQKTMLINLNKLQQIEKIEKLTQNQIQNCQTKIYKKSQTFGRSRLFGRGRLFGRHKLRPWAFGRSQKQWFKK